MDTLVFGCSLPVIRAAWGLAPVRVCPCWANIKKRIKAIELDTLYIKITE